MTTVAVVGLGTTGAPMAADLVHAGFDVVGQRSSARIDALVAAGGRGATGVAEAVADADVVATTVPDSPDVEAVLTGPDGVLAAAQPGTLVIDFSTTRPDVAARLSAQGQEAGLRVLDAPVSGGEPGAVEGSPSIMVGGAPEDFAEALTVLGGGLVGALVAGGSGHLDHSALLVLTQQLSGRPDTHPQRSTP